MDGSSSHVANGIRRISLTSPIVDHSLPPRRASGRRCSMRGRPSRTASAQTLICTTRPSTRVLSPSFRVACSVHSMDTGDSATRIAETRSAGSSRTPVCSASLWSGGKSVAVALTCSNSASGVRLTVNSPVSSTLFSESFRPTEVNCTIGGATQATV